MIASQFIKQHSIEAARNIVHDAPKAATHYCFRKIPHYESVESQSWFYDGEWWESDCATEEELIKCYGSQFVINLSELKQLISSVDRKCANTFIKEWGREYSEKYIEVAESDGDILPWENELKQLIKTIAQIEHMGGINEIRKKFRDNGSFHGETMKRLIAVWEATYL